MQADNTPPMGLDPMAGSPKTRGHTAVMAKRAAVVDDPDEEGGDPNDYFPTPCWAARAMAALIVALDAQARSVRDPACGAGHMVHGFRDYFERVEAFDLIDRGCGQVMDFLGAEAGRVGPVDIIATNPPFKHAEAFLRLAWTRAERGVVLLLRLPWIEGTGRHRLHMTDCPLTVMAPFSERVPMVKGRWDPDASSATAYGVFVYMKPAAGPERYMVEALGRRWPSTMPIPPGQKARLIRPSDYALFAPDHARPDLFAGGS